MSNGECPVYSDQNVLSNPSILLSKLVLAYGCVLKTSECLSVFLCTTLQLSWFGWGKVFLMTSLISLGNSIMSSFAQPTLLINHCHRFFFVKLTIKINIWQMDNHEFFWLFCSSKIIQGQCQKLSVMCQGVLICPILFLGVPASRYMH